MFRRKYLVYQRIDTMIKKSFSYALIALVLFAEFCANADTFNLHREKNTVFFNGLIDTNSAKALIEQIGNGASLIVITSEGGSVKDALDVAREMRLNQVALQVQEYCFSSCANYLFVAAVQKKLQPGAVLGFHGGASGPGGSQYPSKSFKKNQLKSEIENLAHEEQLFFRSIGFDPTFIHISALLTIATTPMVFKVDLDEGKEVHIFYNQEDLKKFLVKILHTPHKWSISAGRPSRKVYFPNQHMLTKYGVKGITEYPYPVDQEAMDMLGKKLEVELVGDFYVNN